MLARVLRVLRVRALVLVRVLRVLLRALVLVRVLRHARVRVLLRHAGRPCTCAACAACAACASTRAVVLVLPRTLGLTGTPRVRVLVVRVRRT